jgi:uncharacterized protein (DUF302 family)
MYVFGVVLESPFDEAVQRVREALAAEGLGVVSDVDVGALLKTKLGEDIGGYRILGACAPALAKRVIEAQPAAGTLLPCNLVVRPIDARATAVDFMDPEGVLALARTPEVDRVAADAKALLLRVHDRLGA